MIPNTQTHPVTQTNKDLVADFTSSPANDSSDETMISVRNISKMYTLYNRQRDRLKQYLWQLVPHGLKPQNKEYFQEFWALKNISFEIKRGETVGIIGRNGSGKSTLLQIIAGTLTPTEGEVEIRGRVAALLELGSGFNPEFTGRENVFLNGAIWGLSNQEMMKRLDRILDFADIGPFIDQPVKTYSSGMFARLAFAVAINIDPDILIVDEILSVGDAQFQQKCVSRLREMKENNLTLLFTSHSVDMLKSVCNSGILLNEGDCLFRGSTEEATDKYLNIVRDEINKVQIAKQSLFNQSVDSEAGNLEGARRYGTGHVRLENVKLLDRQGHPQIAYQFGDTIVLDIKFRALIDIDHLNVAFLIRDISGIDLTGTTTFDERQSLPLKKKGEVGHVQIGFNNCLKTGSYSITLAITRVSHRDLSDNVLLDQIDAAATFEVLADPDRPIYYKFHNPVEYLFIK